MYCFMGAFLSGTSTLLSATVDTDVPPNDFHWLGDGLRIVLTALVMSSPKEKGDILDKGLPHPKVRRDTVCKQKSRSKSGVAAGR